MGESIRIPIEDLFDADGKLPLHSARLMIERAEVVAILDRGTGQHAVIYGLEALHRRIERMGIETPLMMVVEFDEHSDELAKLVHLIHEIKGHEEDGDDVGL
jgi:hypothetical protein